MVTSRLLFYKDYTQDGTGDVNTPKVIGQSGWGDYKFVFSGGNGIIYAVDQAGRLLFFRDKTQDGTGDIGAGKVIGLGGWQQFKFLFSGGNGIIYAIDQSGRLLFYRDYNQDGTGDVDTPKVIGLGGWQQFKFLFSGGNGIIYAVDQAGRLLFYRDYHMDGTGDVDTPKVIGLGGWDAFKFLFSGGNGVIYAVDSVIMKPNAPSDLRVTNVADRKISVVWSDNSNNEDGFRIRFVGKRTGNSDHTGSTSVGRNVTSKSITGLYSNYQYTINAVAYNSDGESSQSNQVQATTPARTISVSSGGSGNTATFTVTGSGFTPNSLIVIKITTQNLQQIQFPQTAGADGKFASTHQVSCVSSSQLTFTAYEDADPQGTFANAVVTTCP